MNIIAIDPGKSGGIAHRYCGEKFTGKTTAIPMPATEGDVLAALNDRDTGDGDTVCFIEEVWGFAGEGQPGSSMFRFGEGFGFIKGVAMALGFRIVMVKPAAWQKAFSLGTAQAAGSKTAWKNKLKAEAQRRFPELKVTLKTCDALLLLDYAMARPETGEGQGLRAPLKPEDFDVVP